MRIQTSIVPPGTAVETAFKSVGIILYDNATNCPSVKFYSMNTITELDFFDKIEPIVDVHSEDLNPQSK